MNNLISYITTLFFITNHSSLESQVELTGMLSSREQNPLPFPFVITKYCEDAKLSTESSLLYLGTTLLFKTTEPVKIARVMAETKKKTSSKLRKKHLFCDMKDNHLRILENMKSRKKPTKKVVPFQKRVKNLANQEK